MTTGDEKIMDMKLLKGVRSGDVSQLKSFVKYPNIDSICMSVTAGKNNILHIAARSGRKEYAMELVSLVSSSTFRSLLIQPDCGGNTPLHCAVLAGHSDFVSFLVSKMDDVGIEKKNHQGDTALHLAAARDSDEDLEIVKILVEACEGRLGSDVNYAEEYPIYVAAERGGFKIMEYLLKFREFPATGPDGKSALHAAVARSRAAIFSTRLVKARPELLTKQDDRGSTPLHYVASCGDQMITKLLLAYGDDHATKSSDIEEYGTGGLNNFHLWSNHVAHICDNKHKPPIHVAAVMGHVGVVKSILESRPDACELVDDRGRNFLHVAVKHKRINVVKYVIEEDELRDLLTNQQDNNGDTSLHLAVRNHHLEIVRLLLKVEKIAKLLRNFQGMKPLDLAASDLKSSHMEYRMFKVIKNLIESGAEFSAKRLDLVVVENTSDANKKQEKEEIERCRAIADNLTIVSVLIATVTFAAAFTLPGGYKSDPGTDAGMAVLTNRNAFQIFLISNTLAMITSIVVTYLLVQTRSQDHDVRMQSIQTSRGLMKISIAGMSLAFATGTYVVISTDSEWLALVVIVMSCFVPIALYTIKIWPSWYRVVVNGFNKMMMKVFDGAFEMLFVRELELRSIGKWKPSFIRQQISQRKRIDLWRPNSMTYFHTPQATLAPGLKPFTIREY
ncbi:hypothetical protein ZOSMA_148G00110 [Zostera marina]|uniref:PGG domain-containing protein n=1 Tax=Zostera marina TaxID=29655 RepID=A0A0K9PWM1_ZOSMR|nr:hypothetical protein ZOSMA_148G00110 [Zostera marina]